MARQIVLGGLAGEIATAASAYVVNEARRSHVKDVVENQHKRKEVDALPFMEVYSNIQEVADIAAGIINENYAIYPEWALRNWSLERVIVTEESQTKSRQFAKALVIFRAGHDCVLRIWVEVEKYFANNGNNYQNDRHCWRAEEKDEEVARATASFVPTAA